MLKKKVLSILLALAMTLSVFPISAFAAEVPATDSEISDLTVRTGEFNPIANSNGQKTEWKSVETQDVEIYVTDGYHSITNATVVFNGESKTTGEDGIADFSAVEAKGTPYEVSVSAEGYGTKTDSIYVYDQIEKGSDPIVKFSMSFWSFATEQKKVASQKSARSYSLAGSWVRSEDFLEFGKYEDFGGRNAIGIDDRMYFPTLNSASIQGKRIAIYDIADNAWYQSAEVPQSCGGYVKQPSVSRGNYIFFCEDATIYDTARDEWIKVQSSSVSLSSKSFNVIGDNIYVVGYNYYTKSIGLSVYNISSNTWQYLDEVPEGEYTNLCGTFNNDQNIYTMWGENFNPHNDNDFHTNGYAKLLLKFDTTSEDGKWVKVENWYENYTQLGLDAPSVRADMEIPEGVRGTRVMAGNRIYFIGGTEHYQAVFDSCYYDVSSNTWAKIAPLPERLTGTAAVVVGTKIYVVAGVTGTVLTTGMKDNKKTFVYDIETNTWATDNQPLHVNRDQHEKVIFENGRLVIWGASSAFDGKGLEVRAMGKAVSAVDDIDNVVVNIGTADADLLAKLQSEHGTIGVEFNDGTSATLPVSWTTFRMPNNVYRLSNYDKTKCGTYTVYGDVDYSTMPDIIKMPRSNAKVQVTVKVAVESIDEITATLAQGYSYEEVAAFLAELHPTVTAHLSDGTTETLPVTWDVNGLGINEDGEQDVYGTLDLTDHADISAVNCPIKMSITFLPRVMPVDPLEPFSVELETSAEEIQAYLEDKYSQISVKLSNNTTDSYPASWNVAASEYNGDVSGDYTIYGDITINESECLNPNNERVPIVVTVKPRNPNEIISIDPVEIEVPQYVMLGTTEKTHAIGGTPTTVELPETATVHLHGGETKDVPVNWGTISLDSKEVETQEFKGELDLSAEPLLKNPKNLKPPLIVTVTAAQYDVLEVSTNDVSVEVLPGTTLAEVCDQLQKEGKGELHVDALNSSTSDEVYNYCNLALEDGSNPEWATNMDVPGQYELKVSMPEDFIAVDESILDEAAAKVKVTVLPPLEIIEVKPEYMDVYQSVEPENLENVPEQATAVLSNGMEIPIDVEWQWEGSLYQKDLVGGQTVIGNLVNLPSKAKQPETGAKPGTLVVTVIPVDYEVTDMQYEDIFESQTLLTLEEITEMLEPKVTLTISSVTEGITLTTTYEARIALETEKNPDFNRKCADTYIIDSTVQVPSNITVPTDVLLSEVGLQTIPVNVKEIEPIHIIVGEGTAFEDIEKPETVVVTFDVKGSDGEYKKETVEVDWGTGEGYNPFPKNLTEETPVDMTVYGELVGDVTDYANVSGERVPLIITVVRAYEITAITPNRFPASGAMEVKLGSTLEDIYNLLDTHTVELTLKSTAGTTTTRSATFQLLDEDNPNYDPMTEGTYTLTASLELSTGVSNPDNLTVEIVVRPTKYKITSVKGERIGGVVSGTAFEDVPLPNEVTVNRNDGKTDSVGVTWDGSKYNPTKIGSQVVRGTLSTPLPVHLENPNNRQPSAIVTIVNSEATIISLEEVTAQPVRMRRAVPMADTSVPGYTEYRYMATIRYKDGTVSREIISTYVETGTIS